MLTVRDGLASLGQRLGPLLEGRMEAVMATGLYLDQYRLPHDRLLGRTPHDAEMLDWGTGIGHFAYVQAVLGRRVTAFGLGDDAVSELLPCAEALGSLGGFTVVRSNDPVHLPFVDDSFDIVVSCGVLEHVRETGGTELESLAEIKRVLRPQGVFLCAHFPNSSSWIERLNRRLGRNHHQFVYSTDDVEALATNSGFELLEHHLYGMLPRIAIARRLGPLANARMVRGLYHWADRALGRLAGARAQNHFFLMTPRSV